MEENENSTKLFEKLLEELAKNGKELLDTKVNFNKNLSELEDTQKKLNNAELELTNTKEKLDNILDAVFIGGAEHFIGTPLVPRRFFFQLRKQ